MLPFLLKESRVPRRFLLIMILLTLLLAVAAGVLAFQRASQPSAAPAPDAAALNAVPRVTVEQLRNNLASSSPPLVLDLRPAPDFATGHIAGSRVLTLDGIPAAAANLDKGRAIVTVCA